jgi:peptide/nickel transport system permease protein
MLHALALEESGSSYRGPEGGCPIMRGALSRLGKYTAIRLVFLFLALIIAVYLTVIIANMGGELDRIVRAQIQHEINLAVALNPELQRLPPDQRQALIDELIEQELKRRGMDEPFFPNRSLDFLRNAMTLQLGRARLITSDTHSFEVSAIILERLPSTLLLFGTAELLLFFLTLFLALFLSRRYGSFLDKIFIALAPTSAAPGWFYGIFLIMIFAALLRVLPWGGMAAVGTQPGFNWEFVSQLLKHMILPVTAIIISAVFAGVYNSRTFFLIYSTEDHVELAKAKGLSSRSIERRYILRPTMPPIITGFLMLLISMWMGQIVLETIFNWPGIGQVYYQAIVMQETAVIVGVIVIYGYLLCATVFILDFLYAMLDPRVRVGIGGGR